MAADPYLAVTLDAKRRIAQAARALDQPHPGPASWGLLELLEDVWRRKNAALVEFGFLVVAGAAWELCAEEANRLLRPRGPVKIGYASNVRRRLHCLQTAHVGRLRLLGKIHGSAQAMLALEAELHARFAHLRLRGEWFSDGDDLWAFIKGLS